MNGILGKVVICLLILGLGVCLMAPTDVLAATVEFEGKNATGDVEQAAATLGTKIIAVFIIGFFIGGFVSVGLGIVKMMNKDSNPQGAHGAWKYVLGGSCLLALGLVVGILKNTFIKALGS